MMAARSRRRRYAIWQVTHRDGHLTHQARRENEPPPIETMTTTDRRVVAIVRASSAGGAMVRWTRGDVEEELT